MLWAVLAARVLVGLAFFVFGLNFFLEFIPLPKPEVSQQALNFLGAIAGSGYLAFVKVLEIVGGAMVLSGRLLALGLVLVTPVAVNIALYEIFLAKQPGLGILLTVLCAFLVWAYRSHFAAAFALKPKVG
jgi:uncharacterized membrane protein YphA (DoxX/SURF4 family)